MVFPSCPWSTKPKFRLGRLNTSDEEAEDDATAVLFRGLALRGVPRLAPSRLDGRAELIFVFAGDRSGSTEERNISLDVTTPIIVRGCGLTRCDVAGTGDGGV